MAQLRRRRARSASKQARGIPGHPKWTAEKKKNKSLVENLRDQNNPDVKATKKLSLKSH